MSDKTSRRSFLKKITLSTAIATGVPSILVASSKNGILRETRLMKSYKKVSSNDRIQVALIGAGWRGMEDLKTALKVEGVKMVAACDLYDGRLTRSRELFGKDITITRDYNEIIERDDVDAVIIGTPDHYHSIIAVDALKKGKAVYLEKPMVQKIEQGHDIIKAEKSTGKTLQVGSQRVSSIIYEKAKELYEAGEIGELNFVEGYWDRLSALGAWQYSIPPDASEKTIDWERFIAPTVKRPFDPIRFFRWRNYQDYGTGVAGDLFVHLFSGLHVITGSLGPVRIVSTGGLRYWKDGRDVPDVFIGIYDYPKTSKHPAFNLVLRVNFADGSGGGSKIRLVGCEGEIKVSWDGVTLKKSKMPKAPGYMIDTFAEATQKKFLEEYNKMYPPERPEMQAPKEIFYRTPKGYNDTYDHFVNFFNSVRTGKPVLENSIFGLRAAGPALASNLSYFQKKIINWDPEKMKVV
ncbi:gfo/Idh/MocA family oxidoreductase [candidate division KSB1 bacterium]|nr:MAG: gfo/Idh/MocA family oxidoreductase [candidate division KSB1 bacterium]